MARGHLIAESSPTAASLTAPDFMEVDSTEPTDFMEVVDFMGAARIQEPSVASIMEESREAFPPGGKRASVEVFTRAEVSTEAVASTEAAEGADDWLQLHRQMVIGRNETHAHVSDEA
jgi:hypothetical protein